MKWVLLVFIAGGYNGSSPSQLSAQFETLDACKAAYKSYVQLVDNSMNGRVTVRAVCMPTK